jgi:CBS-domain-containing membrane protein
MDTSSTHLVDQMARTYLQLKSQMKSLEEQLDLVRTDMERVLEDQNKSKIVTSLYTIDKRNLVTERILKERVPQEIWKQYKTIQSHTCLYVRPTVKPRTTKRSGERRKHEN